MLKGHTEDGNVKLDKQPREMEKKRFNRLRKRFLFWLLCFLFSPAGNMSSFFLLPSPPPPLVCLLLGMKCDVISTIRSHKKLSNSISFSHLLASLGLLVLPIYDAAHERSLPDCPSVRRTKRMPNGGRTREGSRRTTEDSDSSGLFTLVWKTRLRSLNFRPDRKVSPTSLKVIH